MISSNKQCCISPEYFTEVFPSHQNPNHWQTLPFTYILKCFWLSLQELATILVATIFSSNDQNQEDIVSKSSHSNSLMNSHLQLRLEYVAQGAGKILKPE